MKKFLCVLALVAVIATGTAFASPVHPGGLGIGVLWGGSINDGNFDNNVALSLKIPASRVFWGVRIGVGQDDLMLGVQGDVYILGGPIVPTLGWYLGVGGYVAGVFADDVALAFGVRLPIGLTWQPINILEVFGNVVPQVGALLTTGDNGGFEMPSGGFFGFELGVRLWF